MAMKSSKAGMAVMAGMTMKKKSNRVDELVTEISQSIDNFNCGASLGDILKNSGLPLSEDDILRLTNCYTSEREEVFQSNDCSATLGNLRGIDYILNRIKILPVQEKSNRFESVKIFSSILPKVQALFIYLSGSCGGDRSTSIKYIAPTMVRNLNKSHTARDIVPQDMVIAESVESIFNCILKNNLNFGEGISFRYNSSNSKISKNHLSIIFPETGYEITIKVPSVQDKPECIIEYSSSLGSNCGDGNLGKFLREDYDLVVNKNPVKIVKWIMDSYSRSIAREFLKLRQVDVKLFDDNLSLIGRMHEVLRHINTFNTNALNNFTISIENDRVIAKNANMNYSLIFCKNTDIIQMNDVSKVTVIDDYTIPIKTEELDPTNIDLTKRLDVIDNFIQELTKPSKEELDRLVADFINEKETSINEGEKLEPEQDKVLGKDLKDLTESENKLNNKKSMLTDIKDVSVRIAAKNIVENAQKLILDKLNPSDANYAFIRSFIESEAGFALIGFVLSNIGSNLNINMPALLEEIKLVGYQSLSDKFLSFIINIMKNALTEDNKLSSMPEIKLIENKHNISHENTVSNEMRNRSSAKE